MTNSPIVSVVVINYNGKGFLRACLDSVFAQNYKDLDVIFVDNGSSDRSVEFVKEVYPQVRAIVNDRNLGYAPAANIGIMNSRGEFVAILNNDTKTDPAWIENLIKAMRTDPGIGSASPKQLKFDNPKIIDAAGVILHRGAYQTNRGSGETDEGQYEATAQTFGPSGAAAIYRRSMLEDAGLFDDDFFSYQEEFDLSIRARLRGWKSVYVHDAVVYHMGGRTKASSEKNFLIYYMERNRLLTLIKDYPLGLLARYFPYILKYEIDILKRLVTCFETSPMTARLDAMMMLPKMLAKRCTIQKRRVASVTELERWIAK